MLQLLLTNFAISYLSQHRISRFPFWVFGRLPDVPRCVMTKTVANPCQFVKLFHSRRGSIVALCERVRAVLSSFHRKNRNVPMAN